MLPGLVSLPRQARETPPLLSGQIPLRGGDKRQKEIRQVLGWGTKVTGDSNHLFSRSPSRSGGAQGGKGGETRAGASGVAV